jgi:probable rRNA maturation factor
MSYLIDIQHASEKTVPVTDDEIIDFATLALKECLAKAELTIRLVDAEEITHLNHTYRKKNKPTNVLAFRSNIPAHIELDYPFIGDVIICPQVLATEAQELHKSDKEHWSLIVIHGVLHLLGFDHIDEKDAEVMQAIEVRLLKQLGFEDPYLKGINLD